MHWPLYKDREPYTRCQRSPHPPQKVLHRGLWTSEARPCHHDTRPSAASACPHRSSAATSPPPRHTHSRAERQQQPFWAPWMFDLPLKSPPSQLQLPWHFQRSIDVWAMLLAELLAWIGEGSPVSARLCRDDIVASHCSKRALKCYHFELFIQQSIKCRLLH